jgi:hypothetical protein
MNKQTCTICHDYMENHFGPNNTLCIGCYHGPCIPSQEKEQDWEKEWDLLWGIAPKGTPKYEKGQSIKQFIRSHDKEVREQERQVLREKLGNTTAKDVWPTLDKLTISEKVSVMHGIHAGITYAIELLQDKKPEE